MTFADLIMIVCQKVKSMIVLPGQVNRLEKKVDKLDRCITEIKEAQKDFVTVKELGKFEERQDKQFDRLYLLIKSNGGD